MTHTIVITGASRGLGLALAKQLAAAQVQLIGLARNSSTELATYCQEHGYSYQPICADLSTVNGLTTATEHLKEALTNSHSSHFWLINNAGAVTPIAQAPQLLDAHAIAQTLQLNVSSLISLCATFLAHTPENTDRRILNISSGAGRSPVAGWGVYGTTKAAVDYYTQTLALELPQVRSVALAPGVIDTDMQADIRQTTKEHFPSLDRFTQLHENKQLISAEVTAEHIIRYLSNDSFGTKTIDDIRHYF